MPKENQFSFLLLKFDKTVLSNRIRDVPSDDVNGTRVRIGDSRAKRGRLIVRFGGTCCCTDGSKSFWYSSFLCGSQNMIGDLLIIQIFGSRPKTKDERDAQLAQLWIVWTLWKGKKWQNNKLVGKCWRKSGCCDSNTTALIADLIRKLVAWQLTHALVTCVNIECWQGGGGGQNRTPHVERKADFSLWLMMSL